ncbi:MAG: FAD:protein FMN transferase [Lachnospiraceae bacterium]|nr:FAD:protein FMN transferase [Lachnospiraceae bacterium]
MKVKIKKYMAIFTAACLFLMTGCGNGTINGYVEETFSGADLAMDTVISASFTSKEGLDPKETFDKIVDNCKKLDENVLSRYVEDSEISRINLSAGSKEGYALSEKTEEYISKCLEISKATDGTFDITLGAVIDLWDIEGAIKEDTEFRVPADDEIKAALDKCGYEKVKINDHKIYIPEGMILDLGAVGKGIFLDEITPIKQEISRGTLTAGGSVYCMGQKPTGEAWVIGIKNPFDTSESMINVSVSPDSVVSTSGDYERYIESDGIRYHHIIDRNTGYPAGGGLSSVTVIMPCGNGLVSDALSTAVFILGEGSAQELADKYGAQIIMITTDGDIIKTN